MKNRKEIRKYAEGFAWGHFYSEEDVPWEPFEYYPKEWLEENCEELADAVEKAMLWAQGEMK